VPALSARGEPLARPLGVGVLGCAEIARRRFLPAAAGLAAVRIAAVASRDAGRAADVAAPFACATTDYAGLIRSDEVDLVYVPLPNHLHEEWVVAALEHGKHVLCEKPLGLSSAQAGRMLDAAERNGRLLFENVVFLAHPQHGKVAELLADGRIGAVTGLHCTFHIPLPAPGNHRLDASAGGGAFHDLGRYPLGAAHRLLRGDLGAITRCATGLQDGVMLWMEAETSTTAGQRLSFSIAFGKPYECWYELRGTEGVLRLERAFTPPPEHRCSVEIRRGARVDTIAMTAHDQWALGLDHVAARIAAGGPFVEEQARSRWLARCAERFLAAAGGGSEPR
jgi:NDP-hexose-3-ketoreductase